MIKKIVFLMFFISFLATAQKPFKKVTKLMGCRFEFTVVVKDSTTANKHISSAINEVKRIERLISSWDINSQTSAINRNAGLKPVEVNNELFDLINRSIAISKLTDGAFDISYASMDRIWKFDGSMKQMPSEAKIKKSVEKVAFQHIVLNKEKRTVFLKEKGMKIGFGAIGKGYAADKVKQLLIKNGVSSGIINASGDMSTWGKQPNGKEWKVAITNPLNKNKSFALLPITDRAVVTSGDYEKFVAFKGERYSHIIDTRTGYPAKGVISVTVFAPKAELADALATSIFVMGKEIGLHRVNQIPAVDCILIDDKGKVFTSNNIQINK